MEVEGVEAHNGVNNIDLDDSDINNSMAIDMVLPRGFEGLSELGTVETTDLGEDWVSLFFDENYLNTMTANGDVEPSLYQKSGDGTAARPALDSDGSQLLSHSTMILSSSPASASSGCPSYAPSIYPDNIKASNTSLPSSTAGAVSEPGSQEVSPITRPTSSPESTVSQASGASSSGVQPNWWGNEDLDEGSHHLDNEEEESSTDTTIPGAVAGVPVMNNTVPIQAEEVKSGAEPASSVRKIAATGRSSVERSERKRRSWEREEADNGQQQSCSQSEIDIRIGSDSADGADKDEDDEKRQARLMRNRESAQLSRQRKKVYVDELEGRVRTMVATIAELNATISHLTAENVNLRRQLGFFYQPSRPGGGMPIMPYPGMIRPIYPGAPMPPVPIPRLKSQQTLTKTPKRTKSTREPGEKKARKVASLATVGVMGLLCVTMLLGPFGDWGSSTVGSGTTHIHVGNAQIRVGGRVLTSWNEESENLRNMTRREPWVDGGGGHIDGVNAARAGARNGVSSKARSRNERPNGNVMRRNSSAGSERVWQSCAECYSRREESRPHNLGEKFVATNLSEHVSLIVPRNNRLIKVDGNLIITAVMAGDKAAQESGKDGPSTEEGEEGNGQTKQDSSKNSRSPPTPADHQLIKAISTQAQEGGGIVVGQRHSKSVGALPEGSDVQKPAYRRDALAPSLSATFSQLVLGSLAVLKKGKTSLQAVKEIHELHCEDQRASCVTQTTLHGWTPPSSDHMLGSFQQWVLEAYCSGPVLSTGMCTEVFRFDTSPAGAAPNSEASRASSTVIKDHVNAVAEESNSKKSSEEHLTQKKRDPYAVPLPPIRRKDCNGTKPAVEKVFEEQQHRSKMPEDSTMVVSVFTGHQDVAGEERTGSGAAKGLSQIFVVVLVDSVKYVTYSCMLPATASQVHVVAS